MKTASDMPKQSTLQAIGNVFWILKYVFRYAQTLVWDKVIRIPITVFSAYIEINLARWILDSVETGTFSATILTIVLIFSFFIIVNCVYGIMNIFVIPQKQINLRTSIRKDLIEKVGRIDQLNFQDSKFFDDYTLALNEVDTRAIKVLDSVATIVSSLISFYVISDTTAKISSKFSLFGIAAVFIDMGLGVVKEKIKYRQEVEITADNRKRTYVGRVTYQPEFTSDLKVYPRFKELLIFRYEQATISVKKIIHKYAKKIIWLDQGQQIPGIIFRRALPWAFIAWLLFQQKATIPEAMVLSSAAITLPSTLTKYMQNLGMLYTHGLYIEKLRKLFSYEERIERDDKDKISLQQPVHMMLKDVSFSYAKDMPTVLKQVSLNIQPGERIAIVGYNGAGKTTLAKLMIRLFDSTEGQLLLNGEPVHRYNVKSVRSKIIYLSQDFKVYGFTIAENILMRPVAGEADIDKVNSALKMVGLYEKVSALEKGIHTFVTREFESEGAYFSGGELQKLALARICAGEYDFIILDESTSALDPISEDEILKIIFDIFHDKTIVMISHRLATIHYVNHVYFMEQGEVIEHGSHQQLMELQGQYAKFYSTQADKYGDAL